MTNYTLTPQTGHFGITGYPAGLLVLGDLTLNPAGPLYPFMLTYIAASAGLTAVYDAANYPNYMQGTAGIFPSKTVGAKVGLDDSVRAVRAGALPQPHAETNLCVMLVNTAYESLNKATRTRLRGNPVFEFFRHVRNAASHGNKWHFSSKEPARPAAWKILILNHALIGNANPLQGQQCIHGSLLLPGDLLFLLRDVETLI